MVVSSLVRRGVELASAQDPQQPNIHFSGWLIGSFFFTILAFAFCLFKIDYTYGLVVGSLAAVEETNPEVYVRIDATLDPTKPNGPNDPTEIVAEAAAPKPITRKLRTTIKHLRARAGFWSRFRGFNMYMFWMISTWFITSLLPIHASNFLGQMVGQVVIAALLANLRLAWVHIVISEPSPKRFYQRIPSYKVWSKIAPVAALCQAANSIALYLPLILTVGLHGFKWMDGGDSQPDQEELKKASGALIAPGILCFLVSIFTNAIFVRVAASMLPDEHEAIVPFDRHFGGKVVPALLGGSGMLSIKDAWATFDRAARVRYLKTMGKVFLMHTGVIVLFVMLLLSQVYAGGLL